MEQPRRSRKELRSFVQQSDRLVLELAGRPDAGAQDSIHTSVQALGDYIHSRRSVRMLTDLMIREARSLSRDQTSSSAPIRDTTHLLELINQVISMAPTCDAVDGDGGLVGCPLNILFRPLMSTPSGWSFFNNSDVNEHLRAVLTAWSLFLELPESTSVLSSPNGWCSSKQLAILAAGANRYDHAQTFQQIYVCPDPKDASTLGFACWDDYFLREFHPGQRPLGLPVVEAKQRPGSQLPFKGAINYPMTIFNPCESSPVRLASNVKHTDTFWLKHQPYSLVDMLDSHWSVDRFTHGTIYQAFLSAFMYHRWHAPVSGRVVSIQHMQGTYFSQAPVHAGLEPRPSPMISPVSLQKSPSARSRSSSCSSFVLVPDVHSEPEQTCCQQSSSSDSDLDEDPAPPNKSQPYLAAVATRMLILFEADSPALGLVGFMAVGMAEVSSCEAIVRVGQHVRAGDQIGMFHYGGSSCCLLLEPSTASALSWQCDPMHDQDLTYRINGVLATVRG